MECEECKNGHAPEGRNNQKCGETKGAKRLSDQYRATMGANNPAHARLKAGSFVLASHGVQYIK